MIRRKKGIVIEFEEVVVMKAPRTEILAWCGECYQHVRMATPDEAAVMEGVNSLTVYQWVDGGRVHFTETPEGRLLICTSSLPTIGR